MKFRIKFLEINILENFETKFVIVQICLHPLCKVYEIVYTDFIDPTGLNYIMFAHNTVIHWVYKLGVYMIPGCPLKILNEIVCCT